MVLLHEDPVLTSTKKDFHRFYITVWEASASLNFHALTSNLVAFMQTLPVKDDHASITGATQATLDWYNEVTSPNIRQEF